MDEHEQMEIEMTKMINTPAALTDEALDDISGGTIFVKIPEVGGDVIIDSYEPTASQQNRRVEMSLKK